MRTLTSLVLSILIVAGCNRSNPPVKKPLVTRNSENTWTSDALQRGDIDAVKQCVRADPDYLQDRDYVGNTPLLTVIGFDNLQLVQFLLENGADPNVSVDDGYTCLLTAVESDSPDSIAIVESLIGAGADIHETGTNGLAPLHMAAARGQVEKARLLILAGANIDQRKNIDGSETPLMLAAFTGQPETVRLLLDHGADASLRDTDNNLTPLEIARDVAAGPDPDVYNHLKEENIQIDVDDMFSDMNLTPEQLTMARQIAQDLDMAKNYIESMNSLIESGNHAEVIRILTKHTGQR